MNIGTKSLLFGVHLWFWHPFLVALAWWKLYGFPFDPRLWVAFLVHDWGYWGCPEMDGPKGDLHPYVGAQIMGWLFDGRTPHRAAHIVVGKTRCECAVWHNFALYHSRFLAKQQKAQPSRLCMADKLAVALEPWWLYLPRAWASGELKEYMRSAEPDGKHGHMNLRGATPKEWYQSVQKYLRSYVAEHKDGKKDTVTQVNEVQVNVEVGLKDIGCGPPKLFHLNCTGSCEDPILRGALMEPEEDGDPSICYTCGVEVPEAITNLVFEEEK